MPDSTGLSLDWKRICVAAFAAALLHAPDPARAQDETQGFGADIGVFRLRDDNVFNSAQDELTSNVTRLAPNLSARFGGEERVFEIGYEGEYGRYDDSPADDYEDHAARASGSLPLGRRARLDLEGSYADIHESRGTGLTEGFEPGVAALVPEPDLLETAGALMRLTFGNSASRGNVSLSVGADEREYQNHRARTRSFDREAGQAELAMRYRVAPSTALLLSLSGREIEYPYDRPGEPTLDNDEYRALLGVTWEAAETLEGTVRVGYVKKEYESALREPFSEPSWELDVVWRPRTYSTIELGTSRYPSETTLLAGDVVDNEQYSVAWQHDWGERVATRLELARFERRFRAAGLGRDQRLDTYGFTVIYRQRSWLGWELGVDVNSQWSDVELFGYDAKTIRIGARFSL